MNHTNAGSIVGNDTIVPNSSALFATVAVAAVFALLVFHYRHIDVLGEGDLYWVVVDIIDSIRNGEGLSYSDHYGKAISFGYLVLLFTLFDAESLVNAASLTSIINGVGFAAALTSAVVLPFVLQRAYGGATGTAAAVLFLFSPVYLQVALSGHQILLGLACLFAATAVILPTAQRKGAWWRHIGAFALITIGLTMRMDIFLGLPWFVLIGCDVTRASGRRVARLRALTGFASIGTFIVLQQWLAGDVVGTNAAFFLSYFKFSMLPKGIFYIVIACGAITALLFVAGLVWAGIKTTKFDTMRRTGLLAVAIDTAFLVLPSTAFWILNPAPARHFVLPVLGIALLTGHLLGQISGNRLLSTALLSGAIAIGNQFAVVGIAAAKEWVSPSAYVRLDGSPAGPPLHLQPIWDRPGSTKAEGAKRVLLAGALPPLCGRNTVVLTDRYAALTLALYSFGHGPVQSVRFTHRAGLQFNIDGKSLVILNKVDYWPRDAVADVLAEPSLDGYRLIADPLTMSIYDRTEIPPDRRASIDCG